MRCIGNLKGHDGRGKIMIRSTERTSYLAIATLSLFLVPRVAQCSQEAAPRAPAAGVVELQLSFKRDPRMVDPTRGMGPWVSGSQYGGATAQDTVEVRA